jgi:phosphoribosyl 1,2-cyclic phosphodiesterase
MPSESAKPSCRVKFWGVRGSIATPGPTTVSTGGNTTCVEVRADGETIILDAGTGIRLLGRELMRESEGRPLELSVLVTHTHWDHIQGFPFFAPVFNPANHLWIYGIEGAGHRLAAILEGQMETPYFPISMRDLPSNVCVEDLKDHGDHGDLGHAPSFSVGKVRVDAFRSNHPGLTLGYRLHTSAGAICYFPDHESYRFHHNPQPGESPEAREKAFLEFIRGADVLILDSQYDREEYSTRKGWGHGCLDEVVSQAIQANVRRLFLFHHDPDHDDARVAEFEQCARQIAREQGSPLRIDAAREGQEIAIGSEGA